MASQVSRKASPITLAICLLTLSSQRYSLGRNVPKAAQEFQELTKINSMENFRSVAQTLFDQGLYQHDFKNLADINNHKSSLEAELLGQKPREEEPWALCNSSHSSSRLFAGLFLGDVIVDKNETSFRPP